LIFHAHIPEKLHRWKPALGGTAHLANVILRRGADAKMINYYMLKRCCSANRCARIECRTCARRYARRVTREFLRTRTGLIYAVTINAEISNLAEFMRCRKTLWNAVLYRRSVCRWWNDIHLRIWCCRDRCIRGVVALGSITENEFLATLGSRWPITLRLISPEALHDELYAVVSPEIVMASDLSHARYQPRQMTVRPRRARTKPIYTADETVHDPFGDPMPLLIV